MYIKQDRSGGDDRPVFPFFENITLLVDCALQFALISLWPEQLFSAAEQSTAKRLIYNLLANIADPYKAYLEFCQRVLLTRKQCLKDHAFVISKTISQWLHPDNKRGYIGSEHLFARLQEERKIKPLYKRAMKALAEAILDLTENPSADYFNYWVIWFNKKRAYDEAYLFCRFAALFNYKNGMP